MIDSSAYYALADQRQSPHQDARAVSARLISERWHLFTTNFIVAETHALLVNRLGRAVALRVLRQIDASTVTIVRVSLRDERRGRDIIEQYTDKLFSLTDATSFAIMERLHIPHAFSFDSDFTQYGFTRLSSN